MNKTGKKPSVETRIADGSIGQQKMWKFIKEINSASEERLNAVAVRDGKRDYTYRQMFRAWECYAETFSALEITGKNHSRVGFTGMESTEAVFAFYALNMTGAVFSGIPLYSPIGSERWRNLIKKEKLTDLMIGDILVNPALLSQLLREKEELGIRNIILVHVPLCGPCVTPVEMAYNEMNYQALKRVNGAVFWHELVEKYEAMPIVYDNSKKDELAVIMHTSGTTKGINKPIPFNNQKVNAAALHFMQSDLTANIGPGSSVLAILDLSTAYPLITQMHLPLAEGCTVVIGYTALFGHDIMKIIEHYRIDMLLNGVIIIDALTKLPPFVKLDLSFVKIFATGGTYISSDRRKKINNILERFGCPVKITNGYGLSEACGGIIISGENDEDDSIGYPLPGVKVKIYDEEEKKFYSLEDGERVGVLYVCSDSVSDGVLDDEVIFESDEIDGEKYLCSYDMVRVNEKGGLVCIGRMNRYFINNDGIRCDVGLMETAIAGQPGIEACAVVPAFDKRIHDTVPVLFVQMPGQRPDAVMTLKAALLNVFVKDNNIEATNLPEKCVISKELPRNGSGKPDIHRLSYQLISGSVNGQSFNVVPVRPNGKLIDIGLVPAPTIDFLVSGGAIPDEIANEMHFGTVMPRYNKNNRMENEEAQNSAFSPFNFFGSQQGQWKMPDMPFFPWMNRQNNADNNQQQYPFPPFNFFGDQQGQWKMPDMPFFPWMNRQNNADNNQQQYPFPPFNFFGDQQGQWKMPDMPFFPWMNRQNNADNNRQQYPFPPFNFFGDQQNYQNDNMKNVMELARALLNVLFRHSSDDGFYEK